MTLRVTPAILTQTLTAGEIMTKRNLQIGTLLSGGLALGYSFGHRVPTAQACSDDCPRDIYTGTYYWCNQTTWDTAEYCDQTAGELCYLHGSCKPNSWPTSDADGGSDGQCDYDQYGNVVKCTT
jgi:hypothetical protein